MGTTKRNVTKLRQSWKFIPIAMLLLATIANASRDVKARNVIIDNILEMCEIDEIDTSRREEFRQGMKDKWAEIRLNYPKRTFYGFLQNSRRELKNKPNFDQKENKDEYLKKRARMIPNKNMKLLIRSILAEEKI